MYFVLPFHFILLIFEMDLWYWNIAQIKPFYCAMCFLIINARYLNGFPSFVMKVEEGWGCSSLQVPIYPHQASWAHKLCWDNHMSLIFSLGFARVKSDQQDMISLILWIHNEGCYTTHTELQTPANWTVVAHAHGTCTYTFHPSLLQHSDISL